MVDSKDSKDKQNKTVLVTYTRIKIRDLAYIAIALAILSSPLTDIVVISRRYPLVIYVAYTINLIVFFIALLYVIFYKNAYSIYNGSYLIALTTLCIIVILSFLKGHGTDHSLQYTLWFLWIIGVYGIIGKVIADFSGMNIETSYWIEIAVFFASLVGIYDWAIQNSYLAGPSILDLLHRREEKYGHLLLGFIRLRSTVEEAGHFGLFLNAFVPLTLLRKRNNKHWFALYFVVVITAYVLTMSIATWGMAMIAMVIALLLLPQKKAKEFAVGCLMIIAGAIVVLLLLSTENQLSLRLLNAQQDISFIERANMYSTVFNRLLQADIGSWLLGYGPASFIDSVGSNPISWYLLFLHDLGILSLFCVLYLGYYIISHIRRANCSATQKILLQMSALTLMLHYVITANFWHPWLWIVFPLIFNFIRSSNKKPLTVNR